MSRRSILGVSLMLLSALLFSGLVPFAKALYEVQWTPGAVAMVRLGGSAILLIPVTVYAMRGRWRQARRNVGTLLLYGVVSMAGVQVLFFLALEHLSAGVAVLIEMMGAPLIIVAWMWATARVRPSGLTLAGIATALVGVLLVLDLRDPTFSWLGVVLAVGAAAGFAFYFAASANSSIDIPAVAMTGLGMGIGAVVVGGLIVVGVLPMEIGFDDVGVADLAISWPWAVAILVLGTSAAYVVGVMSLRLVGPTVGSFVNVVEIPFAAFVAWLLLSEQLIWTQILGTAIVVGGVVLVKIGDVLTHSAQPDDTSTRPILLDLPSDRRGQTSD